MVSSYFHTEEDQWKKQMVNFDFEVFLPKRRSRIRWIEIANAVLQLIGMSKDVTYDKVEWENAPFNPRRWGKMTLHVQQKRSKHTKMLNYYKIRHSSFLVVLERFHEVKNLHLLKKS